MAEQDNGPENSCIKDTSPPTGDLSSLQIDEWGLTGLSALLTFGPKAPDIEFGERRTGRDRRAGDRRIPVGNRLSESPG